MTYYSILATLFTLTLISILTTTRADLVNHIYLFDNNEPNDETAHYKSIMVEPQNINRQQHINSLYQPTENSFKGPLDSDLGVGGGSIASSNAAGLDLDQPAQPVTSFSGSHLNNNRFVGNFADLDGQQQQQPLIDIEQSRQAFIGSTPEIGAREEIHEQQQQQQQQYINNSPLLNNPIPMNGANEEEKKLEKLMESPLYMQYHRYKEALRRHQLEKQQRRLSSMFQPQADSMTGINNNFIIICRRDEFLTRR